MRGVLWFLVIAALLTLAGVVWLEHRHRQRAADERQYEDELNQEFGGNSETTDPEATTLLPLPDEDLVGPFRGDADPPGAVVPAGAEADRVRAQELHDPDASGSGVAVVSRLTPAQRRRAVKKGRLPRNLPSPAADPMVRAGTGATEDWAYTGPAAGRAGEFHERIPEPMVIWDRHGQSWPVFPTLLESARHEAHFRQWEQELFPQIWRAWDDWEDGFGRLEQTDWIGTAA